MFLIHLLASLDIVDISIRIYLKDSHSLAILLHTSILYLQKEIRIYLFGGCRSELNRLNFRGFYTVFLEKNDELITVATIRCVCKTFYLC